MHMKNQNIQVDPKKKINSPALMSMVLSIILPYVLIMFFIFTDNAGIYFPSYIIQITWVLISIVIIIFCIIGIRETSRGKQKGMWMAITGLIILILNSIYYFPQFL